MSDPLTDRQALAMDARGLAEELYEYARRDAGDHQQRRDETWDEYTGRLERATMLRQTEVRELFAGRIGWTVERARALGALDRGLERWALAYPTNPLTIRSLADALGVLSHRLLST